MGLRTFTRQFFLDRGIHISSSSTEQEVERFISKLRPVSSDIPLIRVGGDGDGGYLVPDDFDQIVACFSPGVADSSDFELDLAKRHIPCFMADYSVDGPSEKHDLFRFDKKFLGSADNDQFMTLESWINQSSVGAGDMILQMDIEGSEYDVILSTPSAYFRRFRTIVIEFHGLDMIFSRSGYNFASLAFEKLLVDFSVVHIHPNNCRRLSRMRNCLVPPVVEFTFHRKDRIKNPKPVTALPHALDVKCVPDRPEIPLPRQWLG